MCNSFSCEDCPQVLTCNTREASIHQIRTMFSDLHDRRREVLIQDIRGLFANLPKSNVYDERNSSTWVRTDELGSGFDTRYVGITWMETR